MKKRLLSTLLVFCMVLALLPGTAHAATVQSGTCGDSATWALDSSGTLSIKGTGELWDYYRYDTNKYYDRFFETPWYNYTDSINRVVIGSGITRIGSGAFYWCDKAINISIPTSVREIGRYAFYHCESLTSIVIPRGVRTLESATFESCLSLSSVLFPDTIEEICGFYGCSNLKNVYYAGTDMQWASIYMDTASSRVLKATSVKVTFDYDGSTLPSPTCTVTFNPNSSGASVSPSSKTVTPGAPYGELPVPTRNGYSFQGWYTKSVGGTRVSATSTVSSTVNHMIYAHWSKAATTSYTVTFKGNGGTPSSQTKTVTNGSTYGTLPTPTRTGYTFKGWYTKSSGGTRVWSSDTVNLTGNQTLYAQWTKNQSGTVAGNVKVTFNANGGSVSTKTMAVTKGQKYGTLPTPTRTGYEFKGWYTSNSGGAKVASYTTVTTTSSSQTLYARWTKKDRMFLVIFDPNGGEPLLRDYQTAVTGTKYRSLPTPLRDGYHFDGWWTKSSGGTRVTENTRVTQTKSHIIYAHWTKSPIKVTRTQTGTWKVTVPAYYEIPIYTSVTGATWPIFIPESSNYRTITCTKKATMSNGTVRYYTKLIDGKYGWFTYTEEMEVN